MIEEFKHEIEMLQETVENLRGHAQEAMECMNCISNLYAPHDRAITLALQKDERIVLKGILDYMAIIQKRLARICEVEL